MDATKKRKYLLYSKDDGRPDSEKPCAFFNSPEGCRNGAKCKFLHGTTPSFSAPVPEPVRFQVESVKANNARSFSSSIEVAKPIVAKPIVRSVQAPPPSQPSHAASTVVQTFTQSSSQISTPKSSKHEKRPSSVLNEGAANIYSFPLAPPSSEKLDSATKRQRRKMEEEEDSNFLFDVVNVALKNGQLPNSPEMPRSNFAEPQNLFIPPSDVMRTLSTSGTDHATKGPERHHKSNHKSASTFSTNTVPLSSVGSDMSGPPFTWEQLVAKTQSHPKFAKEYVFDGFDSTWIKSRSAAEWRDAKKPLKVMAIDCEMCQTVDPVTNNFEQNALIRFSIVNGLNPEEIIVDTLVNPGLPVSDMRTNIHGIKEEQLNGVAFTLRHAQAMLLSICSSDTIIVGHGLINDFKALKFKHLNVIDTSFLYSLSGDTTQQLSPSLREVTETLFGTKLADHHDSVEDARAALHIAVNFMKNGPSAPIVRAGGMPTSYSLLVHRIPDNFTEDQLHQYFVQQVNVVPLRVNPITGSAPNQSCGKSFVLFASKAHADFAFDTIPGPNRPDKQNKPQKRCYLKNGGYFCVRKNNIDE